MSLLWFTGCADFVHAISPRPNQNYVSRPYGASARNPEIAPITEEIDRFRRETTITFGWTELATADLLRFANIRLSFAAIHIDGVPGKPPAIAIFGAIRDTWQYLRCHSMALLIDGAPVSIGDGQHSGDVFRGGVTETVTVQLSEEILTRLEAGTSIEWKICNDETAMAPSHTKALKSFLARRRESIQRALAVPQPAHSTGQ